MKKLITAVTTVLALVLSVPALAVSQAGLNVVDNKVAGVYRPAFGKGALTYLKRHENHLYAVQGDDAVYFIIDEVQFKMNGHEQLVHMLDGSDELVTLKLTFNNATLTLSNGEAVYLTKVRSLTKRDVANVEPHLPTKQPAPVAAESGPSFDCAKAGNKIEFLICGNSALSEMDLAMATGYKVLMSYAGDDEGKAYIRGQQREWIGKRNACADANCLMQSYSERLMFMNDMIEYLQK